MAHNETVFPPDPCPAAYVANMDLLDKEPKDIMLQNRMPWYLMQRLAQEGFTTLRQIAARWRTDEDLYDHAAAEMGSPVPERGLRAQEALCDGLVPSERAEVLDAGDALNSL